METDSAAHPLRSTASTTTPDVKDLQVIKPISKGPFASAFLAKNKTTGKYYAIKVVKNADMIARNQITNLTAKLMAEKDQPVVPFVAKLYFTFRSRENHYMVMEYLCGGDCSSLIGALGSLPVDWTQNYTAQIVLGLQYLHQHDIIHRNLSPDNLLIDKHGHLRLSDLGLTSYGLGRRANVNTDGRDVLGADYFAPETILGLDGHDAMIDWWALGVITYEFLFGIPPFHAETPIKVFESILRCRLEWYEDWVDVPEEAFDFIDRLVTLDCTGRLGASGAEEVKAHTFLEGLDWDNLITAEGPFVPPDPDSESIDYYCTDHDKATLQLFFDDPEVTSWVQCGETAPAAEPILEAVRITDTRQAKTI